MWQRRKVAARAKAEAEHAPLCTLNAAFAWYSEAVAARVRAEEEAEKAAATVAAAEAAEAAAEAAVQAAVADLLPQEAGPSRVAKGGPPPRVSTWP